MRLLNLISANSKVLLGLFLAAQNIMEETLVIAPHVPSLCLFGCLCPFVLGLVPFWVLRVSFFLFACLWCLLAFQTKPLLRSFLV